MLPFLLQTWRPPWAVSGLAAVLLLLGPAGAAHGSDDLQADTWTVADGLPQNTVTGLTQDRNGYLWVATRKGLARFDGLQFQTLGVVDGIDLSSLRFTELEPDDTGGLWIGTYGAGLLHLRADGRLEQLGPAEGIPAGTVWDLKRSGDGRVWAATAGGARVWQDDRWQSLPIPEAPGDTANTAFVDRRGRVWIGQSLTGAVRIDGGNVRVFGFDDGLPTTRVFSFTEDGRGVVWAATPLGVVRFDEARQRFAVVDGLGEVRAYQVLADRGGAIWVATYGQGVLRVDPQTFQVEKVNGPTSDFTLTMFQDRDGGMWIGTVSGGLTRLLPVQRTLLDRDDGLPNYPVTTVYQSHDKTYWVGTMGGGLVAIDRDGPRRFGLAEGLPNNSITSVAGAGPADGIWAGTTNGGAFWLNDGRVVKHLPPTVVGPVVRTVEADNAGHVYFAGNGLLRLAPDGALRRWTTRDGLGSNDIRVLYETPVGLYIGTFGGGLSLLRADGALTTWRAAEGLVNPFVTSVHVDATDTVWIGTYGGGLFRLRDDTLRQISEARGLDDNVVFDIMEDRQRRLWLMMNQGVSVVAIDDANRVADGTLAELPSTFLGHAEGISGIDGTDGNQPQSWLADDGRLWFATSEGVVVVDPAAVIADEPPPTAQIDRLIVSDVQTPLTDAGLDLDARDLVLTFSAPDLRNASRVRYQHRLVGYDDKWSPASPGRTAAYTNLPPGTYRFEVRARRGPGGAFSPPATIGFTVVPRYYETAWFSGLLAMLAIAALSVAYTWRVRRLRRREQTLQQLVDTRTAALRHEMGERERADAERRALDERVQQAQRLESLGVLAGGIAHDFNNLLVGVLGEAGLALNELPPASRARTHLQRIEQAALQASELTAQMLAYSGRGRLVRTPVPLGDTVRDTLRLLSTLLGRQVTVDLALPSDLPPVDADPSQLRQVVMNLLTNASDAIGDRPGRIRVEADTTDAVTPAPEEMTADDALAPGTYVRLRVTDDGAGMDASTRQRIFEPFFTTKFTGRGLGLAAVLGIVRSHGGRIDVESTPDAGTTFTVLLPASTRPLASGYRPQPGQPRPVAGRAAASTRAAVVLVVDDERTVRDVARAALEIAGLVVESADSGEVAVEQFQRHPDRFDLILLDLTLPGMSGRHVFEEIRTVRPAMPIVLTSGFSIDEVADLVTQPHVAFVAKPWRPQDLVTLVQRLLLRPTLPAS